VGSAGPVLGGARGVGGSGEDEQFPDVILQDGRIVRRGEVYQDWVLELGTKERNWIFRCVLKSFMPPLS
jgi:hypothetical protein